MQTHGIKPIDLLVVNLYPFEATVAKGAVVRRLHREHRHRRPGDDPRRRQEPRRRHRGGRACGLRAGAGRARPARRHDHARAAPEAGRQGLCAHRRLRRGDLQLVRRDARTTPRRTTAPSAASWSRRCATARTRTRAPRSIARRASASASPPRARCRASSSPTTTSTTPTRPMNASPSSIPSARAACVIVKHANPCGVAEGDSLLDAYSKALACDSDLGLRRHRRAQPQARRRGRARPSPRSSPR